ncbi:hypothetical protein K440DRAFT_665129 [Wilcoxina mikolae CBS 423.85]|nr:hypothetical protein K440DRAFT_665129 [Wilcoxina mikolae CBS 423.85]
MVIALLDISSAPKFPPLTITMSPLRATPKITVLTTWTFFTLILASVTFAAPVHNATAGVQVSKHQTSLGPMTYATEPAGRGTWGILFSCTTTFVFCIWTAVHPNIIPNASVNYRLFYKGVLMVISIINPEGIAIFAFGQLAEARRVKREWDMYVNGKWESTVAKEKKGLFTMEVAFFVVMGGYTIDESNATSDRHVRSKHIQRLLKYGIIPDADKPEEGKVVIERKDSRYTATLTPTGFVKYAKDGYFDDCQFFGDEIKDKGKASNIAKILSATQALWLGAQCATRKAAGLPLSLLEIHVLIQLGCTVVIYLCWWNKPLDVNEPISLVLRKGDAEFRPIQDEEAKDLLEKEVVELDPDPKQHKDSEQRPISNLQSKHPNEIIKEEVLEEGADPKQQKNLDSAEQHKLPLHRSFTLTRCPPCLIAMSDRALHDIIVYLTGATRNMMVLEGLFIAIIAGLHALAWNNHFPTETEAWLWRIACIGMDSKDVMAQSPGPV